ncbi:hypothetical protein [Tatumella sp. JGM118]|nr:hypothetical protein [Tatumella sp. JGM118]MBS0910868.1 hypothetical protein [Tatumella sp. JGM118]
MTTLFAPGIAFIHTLSFLNGFHSVAVIRSALHSLSPAAARKVLRGSRYG